MLKLVALGPFGYLAYQVIRDQRSARRGGAPALAGGPLSEHAVVQSSAGRQPPVDPYAPNG